MLPPHRRRFAAVTELDGRHHSTPPDEKSPDLGPVSTNIAWNFMDLLASFWSPLPPPPYNDVEMESHRRSACRHPTYCCCSARCHGSIFGFSQFFQATDVLSLDHRCSATMCDKYLVARVSSVERDLSFVRFLLRRNHCFQSHW